MQWGANTSLMINDARNKYFNIIGYAFLIACEKKAHRLKLVIGMDFDEWVNFIISQEPDC